MQFFCGNERVIGEGGGVRELGGAWCGPGLAGANRAPGRMGGAVIGPKLTCSSNH